MHVVRQIAERKRRRVCLEEILPGLVVEFILFPVSYRGGKRYILWAVEKNMVSCMRDVRSTMVAVCGEVWVEALVVFTRGGVSGDGASHATNGQYVVTGHGKEEVLRLFITNGRLEHPLLSSYWEPTATFVHLGR